MCVDAYVRFEPRSLFIGARWETHDELSIKNLDRDVVRTLELSVCPLPMLAIHLSLAWLTDRRCRKCGCTWERPCLGGCAWAAVDLCTACEDDEPPIWNCACGEFVEGYGHCPRCHHEPPWGSPYDHDNPGEGEGDGAELKEWRNGELWT